MKTYVILGDNNFWYSTINTKNRKELDAHIESIKSSIKYNLFDNNDAEKLYAYEVLNSFTENIRDL